MLQSAWNAIPAPMPPVRARSQPKSRDGKKTARRAGDGIVRKCPSAKMSERHEQPGADVGTEDAQPGRPRVVEAGLEIPAVERLFGQRDEEKLAEDACSRRRGAQHRRRRVRAGASRRASRSSRARRRRHRGRRPTRGRAPRPWRCARRPGARAGGDRRTTRRRGARRRRLGSRRETTWRGGTRAPRRWRRTSSARATPSRRPSRSRPTPRGALRGGGLLEEARSRTLELRGKHLRVPAFEVLPRDEPLALGLAGRDPRARELGARLRERRSPCPRRRA